jgi:cell division protein ZapA
MRMAEVNCYIGGYTYVLTCQDGEEEHLRELSAIVHEMALKAGEIGTLSEARTLLFASIFLADKLHEQSKQISTPADPAHDGAESLQIATAVENLAVRMEALAEKLEQTSSIA